MTEAMVLKQASRFSLAADIGGGTAPSPPSSRSFICLKRCSIQSVSAEALDWTLLEETEARRCDFEGEDIAQQE